MSEELINQITLNCLMNKHQYEKYVASKISKSINEDFKKKYKKRIIQLTKDLLTNELSTEKDNIAPDVKYAFDNYIRSCIHYFKVNDSTDINQAQYKEFDDMETKKEKEREFIAKEILEDIDEDDKKDNENLLLVKSIKMCNSTLDSFVTITSTKSSKEIFLPQLREI